MTPEGAQAGTPVSERPSVIAETDLVGVLDADALAARALVPTPRQRHQAKVVGEGREPQSVPPVKIDRPLPGWPWTDWRSEWRGRIDGLRDRVDLRRIGGPRTPLMVFLGIALVGRADDLMITVIGPELLAEFAAGVALLAFVLGATQIVQLLMAPFYGWVVDRVKRVHLLRLAHVFGNLASAMAAFAATPLAFAGLRGSAGLLGVGGETPQATILADYYERESLGRVMTLIEATQNFALVIGPIVGGVVVSATNWRVALLVLGGTATLVGLSTFFLREPSRGQVERRELGADPTAIPEAKPLSLAESWRKAAAIRTLRRIWFAYPFQIAGSAAFFTFVPLYFSESFGLLPRQLGLVTGASAGVGVLVLVWLSPIAGRFLEQNPARIMTLIGGLFLLQAIAFAILGASSLLPISIAAALPLSLGATVVPPLQRMVTVKVVPPQFRGFGFSTVAPWGILGIAVVYLSYAGGVKSLMFSMVIVQMIGALLFATGARSVDKDMRSARASVIAERAVDQAKRLGRTKLLVCRGIEVEYGGTQVLFGVDLDIADGEILALLGTNGAGKSTLLKAIAGLHHASNGAILLNGQDITYEPAHANAGRGIVMMPGGRATFPDLTVAQNLRAASWLYRDEQADVETRLEQVLEFFPVLRERIAEAAGNLSGGEQQMVGLGQAFLMRPRLLLIDELSLGLAPRVVEDLLKILQEIHRQGTTIVIVEQSINVALKLAQRAVFMEKGEIRFDGATEDLLARPDLVRSVFIGGVHRARSVGSAGQRARRQRLGSHGGALHVQDLSVRFGGIQVLKQVNLSLQPGEVVGIIGPNGAGKTTFFDTISGFVTPDEGRVLFDDQDITSRSPDARARLGIGRSFQSVRLFPALTVRENIAVALERRTVKSEVMSALWFPNVREAEAKVFARVDGLVEIMGLGAFAEKFITELSTGSRRAVEVACMMAAEPRLLLLDEPSSGLAQAETQELGPVLLRLASETGAALLVIEHDMGLITSISDRLVAMQLGSVVTTGPADDVLADPRVLSSYLAAVSAPMPDEEPLEAVAAALGHSQG